MPNQFKKLSDRLISTLPPSGAALVLVNTVRVVDLEYVEEKAGRPLQWILHTKDKVAFEGLSGSLSNRHLYCDYENTNELTNLISDILRKGEATAITRIADIAPVITGIPKSLRKIDPSLNFTVIPVWVDTIWNHALSHLPFHRETTTSEIFFAKSFLSDADWYTRAFESFFQLGTDVLNARPELETSLAYACLCGLKERQNAVVIVDTYQNNKSLTGGMLLAVSIVLSRWLSDKIQDPRIGIALPPGLAGTIVNLACVLSGKIPVNLNFTAGRMANESAIRQGNIQSIITASAIVQKIPDFPWTEQRFDIAEILKSFPKWQFLLWRAIVLMTPASQLAHALKISTRGGDSEAGLLFTSGSSGEPKGVVLSHRNIISNVAQVNAILPPTKVESLLGCLPIFHSFGFTVTLWWPLICGPKVVSYISPLEPAKLAEIVSEHHVALMITTPTFLRGFMRRATAEQLHALKLVVTGAEKLPLKLMNEFETQFQIPVCEGYGMTEATPVISTNLLEDFTSNEAIPMRRPGSVGRMVPGISVKVTSTETGELLSPFETGVLWYKGANIFSHYLNDPVRTKQVLVDGWYSSGDVGRVDEDGFLYIEGRISRFSKMAGEMVPHGTIEQYMNEVCHELAPGEEPPHSFVMGVSDPIKGESLVALTTSSAEVKSIRQKMVERGLANLWIPRVIYRVENIPTLASGKLDLRSCHSLVENVIKRDPKQPTAEKLP